MPCFGCVPVAYGPATVSSRYLLMKGHDAGTPVSRVFSRS